MKIYQGTILPRQRIVKVIDHKNNQTYVLPNWEQGIEPDFNWGYSGQGSLSLSLSLVQDIYDDLDPSEGDDYRAFHLKENLISILDQNKGWTLSQEEIEGASQEVDREPNYDK